MKDGDWRNDCVNSINDFFKEPLKKPPNDFSSVVWHPSAGMDWRPFVFWSKGYLERKANFSGLTPATLHVMTTMGVYEEQLMEFLESDDRIAWQDDRTMIRLVEFEYVALVNEDLWRRPSRRHYNLRRRDNEDVFRQRGADGFSGLIEIVDKESGYVERIPMLYLLSENIATYEHFVSSGFFRVRHVPAICEGLAFGGCGRSLIDYLAQTGLGVDNLESVWVREGESKALRDLRELDKRKPLMPWTMPMCFGGTLSSTNGGLLLSTRHKILTS
jgi:hypothetical protein